jgi:hypothetical protein
VGIFQRRSKWQRLADRVTSEAAHAAGGLTRTAARKPAVRAGAAAAAGAAAITMVSAAVSALRRKESS